MSVNPSDVPKTLRQRRLVRWLIGGQSWKSPERLKEAKDYLKAEIQYLNEPDTFEINEAAPVLDEKGDPVLSFLRKKPKTRYEAKINIAKAGEAENVKTLGKFKTAILDHLPFRRTIGKALEKYTKIVEPLHLSAAKSNLLWGALLTPVFAVMDAVQGYKETQGNLAQKIKGAATAGLKSCVAQAGGNAVFAFLPFLLGPIGITGGLLEFGLSMAGSIVVQNFLTKKLKIHPDKKKAGAQNQNQATVNPFARQGMQASWGAASAYQGMAPAQQSPTSNLVPDLSPAQIAQPYSGGGPFSGSSGQQSSTSDKALTWAMNPNSVDEEIANLKKSNGKNAFL